ncbi:GNAT family N-acetyltransferase [Methylorubrum zatmanii]|nr:GNAT family protein [Methylorubrum zatmanii]ARO54014.1 GNAT family N-acetyltransferase [Methylorubrum zatmanii]
MGDAPKPGHCVPEGRYTHLDPLSPARHGQALLQSAFRPGAEDRFRYLFDAPPVDQLSFAALLKTASTTQDPLFIAVLDQATGRAEGRQSLMRIDPVRGVIENGHILWGPAIARTHVAMEAFILLASYAFDKLGYRGLEWKYDGRNTPSRNAAAQLGFAVEGIFRHHMVMKGESRDTAWFSIIGPEWPGVSAALTAWVAPSNFDETGQQRRRLEDFRA